MVFVFTKLTRLKIFWDWKMGIPFLVSHKTTGDVKASPKMCLSSLFYRKQIVLSSNMLSTRLLKGRRQSRGEGRPRCFSSEVRLFLCSEWGSPHRNTRWVVKVEVSLLPIEGRGNNVFPSKLTKEGGGGNCGREKQKVGSGNTAEKMKMQHIQFPTSWHFPLGKAVFCVSVGENEPATPNFHRDKFALTQRKGHAYWLLGERGGGSGSSTTTTRTWLHKTAVATARPENLLLTVVSFWLPKQTIGSKIFFWLRLLKNVTFVSQNTHFWWRQGRLSPSKLRASASRFHIQLRGGFPTVWWWERGPKCLHTFKSEV